MKTVHCPGCLLDVEIPAEAGHGYQFDCENCAGLTLRLEERGGQLVAVEVKKVSCPNCDRLIELPGDARAGDIITCCGKRYQLSYEWGSFAAEPE